MKLWAAGVLALALAWAGAGWAADDLAVSEAVRKDIAEVIALEDDAWNRGDAAAYAGRALDDIGFTNVMGASSVGKTPFVAQHARLFEGPYKGSRNRQQIERIRLLKPDVAIVDTLAILSGFQRAPPGIGLIDGAIQARLQQVMVRRGDGWWVAEVHNVAVNPAAGGPPRP